MFPELNNILNLDQKSVPGGQCILIREGATDGEFLLHHFISLYLRAGHDVCFVGFAQSYSHYNNVGNKLGVSCNAAKDAGNLVFIEALKLLGGCIVNSTCGSEDGGSNPFSCVTDSGSSSLKLLYQHIKSSCLSMKSSTPTILIIDDLRILAMLGTPVNDIVWFVHYLHQLTCASVESNICLLIRTIVDNEDDDSQLIANHIHHQSDLVLDISGLPSGYCKDVHGELTFTWRDKTHSGRDGAKSRKMQYKIGDKTVSFFALGMSAAVI